MDVARLDKNGQLCLPAAILRKIGIQGIATLIVETTEDGAVVLRPAAVYPVEMYSEARLKEFEKSNRRTAAEAAKVRKALTRREH